MRVVMRVAAGYQPVMRVIGLDAEAVFTHPDIRVWRTLPDRENATLDADLPDGRHLRLHVKRYQPSRAAPTPAEQEFRGFQALADRQIPTAPLIAWGTLDDGRSFVITEDLSGYAPADKLVESGTPFQRLLDPTADLAGLLHCRGLHHRDLYLCHFMAKVDADRVDLKLIDVARVRPLPTGALGLLTRRRWVVKDLAQFWYSTTKLPAISDEQRGAWLARYAQAGGLKPADAARLRRSIERKVRWIARHDQRLNRAQPTRNISIPTGGGGGTEAER